MKWNGWQWMLGGFLILAASGQAQSIKPNVLKQIQHKQNVIMNELKYGNTHFSGPTRKNNRPKIMVLMSSGCSASAEQIFHLPANELYVNQIWGDLVSKVLLGSLEHGAKVLHIPVLIVIGDRASSAVKAAIREVDNPRPYWRSPNMKAAIQQLEFPVREVSLGVLKGQTRLEAATQENVQNVIREILEQSPALWQRRIVGTLKIEGAIYSNQTGKLTWLPPVP